MPVADLRRHDRSSDRIVQPRRQLHQAYSYYINYPKIMSAGKLFLHFVFLTDQSFSIIDPNHTICPFYSAEQ